MRPELHIDFETRSVLSLPDVGLPNYSIHPTTDMWCACWTYTDGLFELEGQWIAGDETTELRAVMAEDPDLFAHNAGFEHAIWREVLDRKYGVRAPADFDRWTCTAAMAAAFGLPRDLARAAVAMGLDIEKDAAGKRLMLQMCKPRSKKGVTPIVWWDDPEKIARLVAYCATDVKVEAGLAKTLRPLSLTERKLWQLDHRINQRGIRVDVANVALANTIAEAEGDRLDAELFEVTAGECKSAKYPVGITAWLRTRGLVLPGLDKATLKELVADIDTFEPDVARAIMIRDEARRSSTAKLLAFLVRTSPDGRLRDQLKYHGASTGRWTGSGVQLQNLIRQWLKHHDILTAIEALPLGRDWLTLFGKPLDVIANMMKAFLIADPGHELVMADFSNIEGVMLAWLAGEDWKLDAFRAFFAGTGTDLYVIAAAKMMGLTFEDVDDAKRQIGKVSELSLGFGGGHGALLKMMANYGVKVVDIAPLIRAATPQDEWDLTAEGYDPKNRHGLDEICWVALRVAIDSWRRAHPAICSNSTEAPGLWKQLEDACFEAVCNPGKPLRVGRIGVVSTRTVLWLILPSGRPLPYANPLIKLVDTPWGKKREAVTFMGVNQDTGQWQRQSAYGGLWAQQVTQASARDLMAEAMIRVEERGWPVVLTVHDEIISEVPQGTVSGEEFGAVMRELPAWAEGLPVTAKGLTSPRYRK